MLNTYFQEQVMTLVIGNNTFELTDNTIQFLQSKVCIEKKGVEISSEL